MNMLGPVLGIAATALLLLLREFVLSIGKSNRKSYGARSYGRLHIAGSSNEREPFRGDPIREFEEPNPEATLIEVDEFLAELRLKAQEQARSSKAMNSSTTDPGKAQSNRMDMMGGLS